MRIGDMTDSDTKSWHYNPHAIFVYEVQRTGDWFFVLIKDPNLFYTATGQIDGYYNEGLSESFGPFSTYAEALEKATVLLEDAS